MRKGNFDFSRAQIPYGVWGSSFFPAWQTSPLAEVNIGQFAGEAMNKILGLRGVPKKELEYLIVGSTIPWHWKFWNATMVASCLGVRIPGYHVEQACATGLRTIVLAAAEVQCGLKDVVGVLTFDRTSDSPVGVFPERRAYQRTQAISDVWDNFGFDPASGKSMIAAAGTVARKYKLDRREVDEVAYHCYKSYFECKSSGFYDSILVPLEILNVQGRPLGMIDADTGVRSITLSDLRSMRELDNCVTAGTQTHASDGMGTLLVCNSQKAKELSLRPEIDIEILACCEYRTTFPAHMPEAPTEAVKKLLAKTNMKLEDISVIKTHNPFAMNDVLFAKEFNYDWSKMNKTGCSLVWGHPQAPTLTRSVIEGLEETVRLGGGYLLVLGCAAGDVGLASLFKVSDGGNK